MSDMPYIRIHGEGMLGYQTRVFYVRHGKDEAGERIEVETEISGVVRRVETVIEVNDINQATLYTYGTTDEAIALIEDIIFEVLPVEKIDAVVERLLAFKEKTLAEGAPSQDTSVLADNWKRRSRVHAPKSE